MFEIILDLTEEEQEGLLRFNETLEDDQDYDVDIKLMKELSKIGLVRSAGFSRYELTLAGHQVVELLIP